MREVAPDLPPGFALELQQAMDRDPDRRPPTAGDLLDRLESAITSRNRSPDRVRQVKPAIRVRGVGLGALLVVFVGVAETVWLLEGSGLKLVQHTLQRVFGAG